MFPREGIMTVLTSNQMYLFFSEPGSSLSIIAVSFFPFIPLKDTMWSILYMEGGGGGLQSKLASLLIDSNVAAELAALGVPKKTRDCRVKERKVNIWWEKTGLWTDTFIPKKGGGGAFARSRTWRLNICSSWRTKTSHSSSFGKQNRFHRLLQHKRCSLNIRLLFNISK